ASASDDGGKSHLLGWGTPMAHEARLGYQNRRNGKKGSQKSMTTEVIDYFDPSRGDPALAHWSTTGACDARRGSPSEEHKLDLSAWTTPQAQDIRLMGGMKSRL